MVKHTGLRVLHTPFGVRTVAESVAYCNRCGMCARVCPVYQQAPQESNSPRGRNQALRFVLEGKLQKKRDRASLEKLARSCTLCGQCTRACPGKVPTAQHMLELRRYLGIDVLPDTLKALLRLRQHYPRLFKVGIRCGILLQRMKMLPLLSSVSGLGWVRRVHKLLPANPQRPFSAPATEKPTRIYVPSLEAEFLLPQLAQKTYDLIRKKHRVSVWSNVSSGVFEYVYGDVRRAQKILRHLMTRHAHTGNGKLPLVTDSINVYLFWKQAAQLFEGFPAWQAKATHFASCVQFVTAYIPSKTMQKRSVLGPALLMPASLFVCEGEPFTQAAQILHTHFKKNFVQCEYKQTDLAPFGYGFTFRANPRLLLESVRSAASHQAQSIYVLDGLAALELEYGLRRFYPTARAYHVVQLG